jgi:trimethyllysine dioxygenase
LGDPEKPILWSESEIKPARVDYRDYLVDDEAGKQVVKSLINYGVAFVEKVPANAQQTEFVIRKLFPIHKTLFGEMWTFSDSMDHRDTAYTKEFLGPHHDNTYFNDASGLQILHCIFHEGTDGDTFLVDGFKVCEKIREDHPDVFKRLCETMVPAEYIEEGKHHKHSAPIIKIDPITGRLQQIRYNLYDRAPFDSLPQNKIRQFYKDLKILTNEMDNRENQWWFKLCPGTVMIFDNWRVLHARNHYTGKRTMTGCYVSRTEFQSLARTMNFIR